MSDPDPQQRIRERAYTLWEQEGRPEGRAAAHWALARHQVAAAEAALDEEGAESFPASDPPAHVPIIGERV
ncbi:MAG: DUF2934 domain-containing protein [Paracraurococcus sp.]|jgi:hypothetical protein